MNTLQKNTESLLESIREVDLDVNAKKSTSVVVPCHQNA